MATGVETIESSRLSFEYLSKITKDFSDERKIGVSQFGTLYKGIKEDGKIIAVKKLEDYPKIHPNKRFQNEVEKIMALKHENLVQLFGGSTEDGVYDSNIKADITESLLYHEYFPNGNLDDYIFGTSKATKNNPLAQRTSNTTGDLSSAEPGTSTATEDFSSAKPGTSKATKGFSSAEPSIDWDTRFKIINGICHGLFFLHSLDSPIIHMDLKLGNIWLDDNMVPKIGNFGLSRLLGTDRTKMVTQNVVGSYGHMAPEYLYRGEISTKADIYSLGLLIMEITTREKNCSDDKELAARQYITDIRTGWTAEHIASRYSSLDAERLHQIHSCIKTGLECVEIDRKNRPSIEKIIDKLNAC